MVKVVAKKVSKVTWKEITYIHCTYIHTVHTALFENAHHFNFTLCNTGFQNLNTYIHTIYGHT